MKTPTPKSLILPVIIAGVAMIVSSTSASAQFIGTAGIQFVAGGDASYTGTGVLGETFTVNPGTSGGTQSTTAEGTTGLSLAISDPNTGGDDQYSQNGGNNGTTQLFNNFLSEVYNVNNGLVFTLSGLKIGDTYKLAVYAGPNGNYGGQTPVTVYLNGSSTAIGTANPQNSATGNPANGFQLNVNYVTGTAVADGNGDITIQDSNTTGASNYVLTNGIGIEDVTVAAPEPGTWAMLLAGAGALVGIQAFRRRNA